MIKIVAQNIRKYRTEKGYTQERLSELAEITPEYLSLIELNKRTPSLKRVFRIAKELGIDAYLLLQN